MTEYKCPECGVALIWSSNNPHRPFCSERCKNKDFIGWANGERAIPVQYSDEDDYEDGGDDDK